MKEKQRNNGITLIALVITIIVLLILVGITLNLVLGQNGIIKRGKEANIQYEIAQEKEILGLAISDIKMQNDGQTIIPDEATLEKAMKDNSGIEGITIKKSSKNLYIVTYPDSGRQYEVYADGTIQEAAPKVKDDTPTSIAQKDENTYLIQSIEDLVILSNTVNSGTDSYEGKTFELQCDLNFASINSYRNPDGNDLGDVNGDGTEETTLIKELTESSGFMPIGKTYGYPFNGNIEGEGHTISNLYINRNEQYQGLIGYAGPITVKRLNLEQVNITANGYIGSILGYMRIEEDKTIIIEECHATGVIKKGNNSYCTQVGGIVGQIYSNKNQTGTLKLKNCKSKVDLAGSSCGGVVGSVYYFNTADISNSINEGKIDGSRRICWRNYWRIL